MVGQWRRALGNRGRTGWERLGLQLFADAMVHFPVPFEVNAVDNSDIDKELPEDRISSSDSSGPD